jgi:hypothetical protein
VSSAGSHSGWAVANNAEETAAAIGVTRPIGTLVKWSGSMT